MMDLRPNILIFMTDQQRGDTVLNGAPNRAKMPRLDRFRREGVTFTRAYCPSPHCCPSRTTFMTGHYPSRHGVWNNVNVGNALSREPWPGVPFWSRALAESGYAMHYSGKWHISDHDGPESFGWSEGFVTSSPGRPRKAGPQTREWEIYSRSDIIPSDDPGIPRMPGEIRRPGYPRYVHYGMMENPFHDGDVVEEAVAALSELAARDRPWCLFVGTLGPHDPYVPPEYFLAQYDSANVRLPPNFNDTLQGRPALYRRMRRVFEQLSPDEHRETIRRYLAFCSYQDFLFGRVLDTLDATGQANNTLVLYISDHGDYMADHGLWCKGLPCFRPAYHVPCVVRWPAGIRRPGRDVEVFISLADFAPTLLEITKAPVPSSPYPNPPGRSLMPFFRGESPADWRVALFTQTNGNELYGIQRSVITADWHFTWNGFDEDELYDLRHDSGETVNLAGNPVYAPVVRELMRRIWQFAREQDDICINPYIAVGLAPIGPGAATEKIMSSGPSGADSKA